MSLTTEERDALPESDFAVPGKRQLPMHDDNHIRLAWSMVDRTEGLSPEERSSARERILHRAHEKGIDTSDWDSHVKAQSLQLMAMSLDMPHVDGHPNKVPFSGVLCKLDEPSDAAPGGARGCRVVLSKSVAEKAIPSLLGMAIDFTPNFDGHDKQAKIGIITEAFIDANKLMIKGFFYGADFPEETQRIQEEKDLLGFSYEATGQVVPINSQLIEFHSCVFTGAAVLYKSAAAYQTTSLQAKKSTTEITLMADQKNAAEQQKEIDVLKSQIADLKAENESIKKSAVSAGNLQHLVQPHADSLRASADSMCAAGIGTHRTGGHAAVLRHMAANMEAEAAQGVMPHVYRDHDFLTSNKEVVASKEVTELKDQVSSLTSKLADLEKSKFEAARAPERKTFSPEIAKLLAKADLNPDSKNSDGKLTIAEIDAAFSKTGLNVQQRIEGKLALKEQGLIKE